MARATTLQSKKPAANGANGKRSAAVTVVGKVPAPIKTEELNPFRIAQAQLDTAAKVMGLDRDMHSYLREPQRFLQVSIPVRMDNGRTKTFTGFRCQYNDARGLPRAASATTPKRPPTPSAPWQPG